MSKLKDQVKEFDSLLVLGDKTQFSLTSNSSSNKSTSETFLNQFLTSTNSSIKKMIWLSNSRIFLMLQDATIIWLIIDTISGDLVKILIDKSLSVSSSNIANSLKLSGDKISDCLWIESKKSPVLAISYSDKSKLDLISFNKFKALTEILANTENKLEKLASFEPVLISYEFSCPNMYKIEKKLSYFKSSQTFTIWWPNDGQLVWHPSNKSESSSLLDREDLRNNVLVLSTNLTDLNLMEYLFKSDGLLLSLHYLDDLNLIAIEQTETNNHKYLINIYKYELPNEIIKNEFQTKEEDEEEKPDKQANKKSHKIKQTSFCLNSKIFSIEQIRISKKFILMLSIDQTLIIYDLDQNIVNKFKINDSSIFNGIEWLIDDLIFCVFNTSGQIKLFDIAFNLLDLSYMTRFHCEFKSLSQYLSENLFNSNNKLAGFISSRQIVTDSLWSCFTFTNGPFGLFRLALPGYFNQISLINHYIKNSQLNQNENEDLVRKYLTCSVNLLKMFNWNQEPLICLTSLYKILNFVFTDRVKFDNKIEYLCEESLATFYKPNRSLLDSIIFDYKYQVNIYARKFFFHLLKNGNLNKSFLLAVDIGSKDLINDLYYASLERNELQLAEICRKKYHELLNEEKREKLRTELNRSVTTIDDNIKGNLTEFDNYSCSSTEEDEGENEIESDYSSSDNENVLPQELRSKIKSIKKKAELDLNDKIKLNYKENSTKNKSKQRVFSQEELENYAKSIYLQNEFIHKLNFENLF